VNNTEKLRREDKNTEHISGHKFKRREILDAGGVDGRMIFIRILSNGL